MDRTLLSKIQSLVFVGLVSGMVGAVTITANAQQKTGSKHTSTRSKSSTSTTSPSKADSNATATSDSSASADASAPADSSNAANPALPALMIGGQDPKAAACQSSTEEINNSYGKYKSYCAGSSDADCASHVQECMANNPGEASDSSYSSDDDPDNSAQCYAFGYQNYKSDLKDMKSDQKDSKKTLADLQKDKVQAQKDYNETKAKLMKDFQDAEDDYNKEQMQDKEDQRKQQLEAKAAQDELNKQQRDLQMAILQKQNQQALLTSQRSTQIDDYKMKLLQCKADTQKYQAQVRNHTLSGLAGLSVKGGGAANDVNTYWQSCVNKVLKQRDDDANKYAVAINQLNAEITQAQQQLVDVQKSLQMAQSQAQAQLNDAQAKTQQAQSSFQAKQKNIAQQIQDLSNAFTQQSQQMMQQIQEAMQDNNINSNSLKKFQGQSPPKSDTSASQAWDSYNQFAAACSTAKSSCSVLPDVCNILKSSGKDQKKSSDTSDSKGAQ